MPGSTVPALPMLPEEVIEWVHARFEEANRSVTESLINNPNIRETTLDDALLIPLQRHQAPIMFPSGIVVRMEVHNIGGLRRLYRWEVADIAILVTVFRANRLQGQKMGLLQAKRLYPKNNDVQDNDPEGFRYGMNAFLFPDPRTALSRMRSTFEFDEDCHYQALSPDHDQPRVIEDFNTRLGEATSYLFYNPPSVPETVRFPAIAYRDVIEPPPLGARVANASAVHAVLNQLKGQAPTLRDLGGSPGPYDRLEDWVKKLLQCKVGIPFDRSMEDIVERLVSRRTGPIGAAVAISIALPEDGG